MQNNGLKQGTLRVVNYQLKYLEKNSDLMNPEQVKAFIAQMKQANSYKQCMVKAYNYFADINGIQRLETHFKYQRKIPLIPSSENVRKIISASSKKYATIFSDLVDAKENHIAKSTLCDHLAILRDEEKIIKREINDYNKLVYVVTAKRKDVYMETLATVILSYS